VLDIFCPFLNYSLELVELDRPSTKKWFEEKEATERNRLTKFFITGPAE
jgi:hypothetical protein